VQDVHHAIKCWTISGFSLSKTAWEMYLQAPECIIKFAQAAAWALLSRSKSSMELAELAMDFAWAELYKARVHTLHASAALYKPWEYLSHEKVKFVRDDIMRSTRTLH